MDEGDDGRWSWQTVEDVRDLLQGKHTLAQFKIPEPPVALLTDELQKKVRSYPRFSYTDTQHIDLLNDDQRAAFDQVAARAPDLAAELFDTGVNMGTAIAIGFLQRALNALNRGASDYPDLILDTAIGPRTLAALDAFLARRGKAGEGVLVKAIDALQGGRYLSLAERRPANEAFLYGWLAERIG